MKVNIGVFNTMARLSELSHGDIIEITLNSEYMIVDKDSSQKYHRKVGIFLKKTKLKDEEGIIRYTVHIYMPTIIPVGWVTDKNDPNPRIKILVGHKLLKSYFKDIMEE